MTAKELGSLPSSPCSESLGPNGEICQCTFTGLTKREAFAKAAMQGLRASQLHHGVDSQHQDADIKLWTAKEVAAQAVCDADALLAELAKSQ